MKRIGTIGLLVLLIAGAAPLFALNIEVQPTAEIAAFLDSYGVSADLLATPRSELSASQRAAVTAVLQPSAQEELNGLVFSALRDSLASGDYTTASMVVGSLTFATGDIGED